MIHLKTPEEIEKIRAGGEILSEVLKTTLAHVKEGVTLKEFRDFIPMQLGQLGQKITGLLVEMKSISFYLLVNKHLGKQ